MDGIILINKPKGITSFDVIRKIRKILKIKKIGHTGTLDPFATGLLILCVGRATKLVEEFLNYDKTYVATLKFGNHYDTYDTTGTILNSSNKVINNDKLIEVINSFKGSYMQMPPIYSAIKKDGKKMYEYARAGQSVKLDKRLVTIHDINLESPINNNEIIFKAHVSKGTYIRSLGVDIAEKLNTYGALSNLMRTDIGSYQLSNAVDLDQFEIKHIIPLEKHFETYPKIKLNDYIIKLVKNGIILDERQTTIDSNFIVVDNNDKMIAYYKKIENNQYKPVLIMED